MSYDESDARYDAYMDSLIEEFYERHGPEIAGEAVANFQTERLQSYFVTHPRLIEPALNRLSEARALSDAGHPDAATVFAVSATEVAVKHAMLMPLVSGLVQSEAAAKIIAELTLSYTGIVRYGELVFGVFSELLNR